MVWPRIGFQVLANLIVVALTARATAEESAQSALGDLDVAAYRSVLAESVREGRVDYLSLRSDHLGTLRRFLAGFSKIDLTRLDDRSALAAGIDLYNATVLEAVATRITLGYRVDESEFGLFKEPRIHLSQGDPISLDHLEHEILRKRFPDGLLHVGLVCGAVACPPLEPEPYLGRDARAVLSTRMGEFLRDPKRNGIDRQAKALELSRLFDWFAVDFGGKERIGEYVATYLGSDVRDYRITFREYDWALNLAPPPASSERTFVVFRSGTTPPNGVDRRAILVLPSRFDASAPGDTSLDLKLLDGTPVRVPSRDLEVFHKL